MRRILLGFLALTLSCHGLFGQTSTEFWFAPPEITSGHDTDNDIRLRVASAGEAAVVTISVPANAANFNGGVPIVFNLPANGANAVDLTAYKDLLETRPMDQVNVTGLLIESTTPITAFYEIHSNFNPDLYALKGTTGLGTEFYTPFQNIYYNGDYNPRSYTSFDIVATEDDTEILIYPRVNLFGGHPAFQSYAITLDRGETYSGGTELLPTAANAALNPSGTVIYSDKNIAVSMKDDSARPPTAGCRDLNGDQLVPVPIVGTEYIINQGALTSAVEYAYITATANGTAVSINGVATTTLFAGETYSFEVDVPLMYIELTEPAYVYHVTGFGCESGGAQLPPLNCAGSEQVAFIRANNQFFGLNLLVPTGSEDDFTLTNGNGVDVPIAAASFTPVPGTGGEWQGAQISFNTTQIPTNINNFITNSTEKFSMGLIHGGAGTGCQFGYFSEFAAEIITDAGSNQIVCANDSVQLAGSVTGGANTGIWSTSGTGIFIPDDISFDAIYVPSAGDLATGFVNLTLASTGNCTPVEDQTTVTFTDAPTANAGVDVTACGNNSDVNLNGIVTIAAGGSWSGGAGTFAPNNTTLNATYSPSAAEITAGSVTLKLTTIGNGTCNPEEDEMTITFGPSPTVNAGADQTLCGNNAEASLAGQVTVASGGQWSGGNGGVFSPNADVLNATYAPSAADILAGSVTLTLTTTGNGGCTAETDQVVLTFTDSPTVNAGVDLTLCANNAEVDLTGAVTVATGGAFSGGLGTYAPNNTTLNTTYSPTLGEITSGSVTLILTTTGNGTCSPETDEILVTFTPAPTADAGPDQIVCSNNNQTTLAGAVAGATGGTWSGGAGAFTPNANTLGATYTPTAAELAAGMVDLTLTTFGNGNCIAVSDQMRITFSPSPFVNAGVDQTLCANNEIVSLLGQVSVATGGEWLGGGGTFTPDRLVLNPTYTPSAAELAAGTVTLTLRTTGNGNCNAESDQITINFTPAPTVSAGGDQTLCANNPNVSLSGSFTVATGGQWSGGLGTFTPNNENANAVYQPTLGEITSGSLQLTFTTTGNGDCLAVSDVMDITFTAAPIAAAGADQTLCSNNAQATMDGSVMGAVGGTWSGGGGNFTPNANTLNAQYTPSAGELAAGSVVLTLTSFGNGNCLAVTDQVELTFSPSPIVNAGADQTLCANNVTVNLGGQVSVATGGEWIGGNGTFTPNRTVLNPTYEPSAAELAAGNVTLTLQSTGNGTCNAVSDQIILNFTPPPTANAGADQTLCANNANINLSGSFTIATGGQWSGGLGTFTPNNNSPNTVYSPTLGEITSGNLELTFTTTGNGGCLAADDRVNITFTAAPVVDAGSDQTLCSNNSIATMAGSVVGATGGTWSGGGGSFAPNAGTLNAQYTPSAGELAAGEVTLTLTSFGNGNCLPETDEVTVTFTPSPQVSAGPDESLCANNAEISLAGNISVATGGIWTGGAGTFVPSNTSLNAVYTPTAGEIASGGLTLTLTSTGNGDCVAESDQVVFNFTLAPTVSAGPDGTRCANSSEISLNGSFTIAGGVQWSGGLGTFTPDNNNANVIYQPSDGEIAQGNVNLTLTSTDNGTCLAVTDDLEITFTPAPVVEAGPNQSVCANNSEVTLDASVTIAAGGIWSGGGGTFSPGNTSLTGTYQPSPAEIAAGQAVLTLTSFGNGTCAAETDDVTIAITAAPSVNPGTALTSCANNSTVQLSGSVAGAAGGEWSGGNGNYDPTNTLLNAMYTPSALEVAGGQATLTLTSTGNGNCLPVSETVTVTITDAPTVNAGSDQTKCANNSATQLNGVVQGATGGVWTGGLGLFTPNNGALNAVYTPTLSEINSGNVTLTLTSTDNGTCNAETDEIIISFTGAPTVDAGAQQDVCADAAQVALMGTFTVSGNVQWSGGTGQFLPNANGPNVNYNPSDAEIAAGSTWLYLTTTNNGICNAEIDSVQVLIAPTPIVNAGANVTVCENNLGASLSGIVQNATGGQWSGGSGDFNPSNTSLNAIYTPSPAEVAFGSLSLTLTSTGNGICNAVADNVTIDILPAPIVDAGVDQTVCRNNADVALSATVTNAVGGQWSGGSGTFNPSSADPTAVYIPSTGDLAMNSITLTYTSTGNGGCLAENDAMMISFTQAPVVSAGLDESVCANNADVTLSGSVVTATGATWSGGLGTFAPDANTLAATYTPTEEEIANGQVQLTITTTGNGTCLPETDNLQVSITAAPQVSAGADQIVCVTELDVALAGQVSGVTTEGEWSTTGTGFFVPNQQQLDVTYQASSQDSINNGVNLVLSSINNGTCLAVTDTVRIDILPAGGANAGSDMTQCANNLNIQLSGQVTGNATTGTWLSSGTGVFLPNSASLNASYLPSDADLINGGAILTLVSNSCNAGSDQLEITITPAPVVNAGNDITVCSDNLEVQLGGSVTEGSTEGLWTTDGSGSFTPLPSDLGAMYNASAADVTAQTVPVYLTSTNNGNCLSVQDTVMVNIFPQGFVNAGADQIWCSNNANIAISGTVTGGVTGSTWTSDGTGSFLPNANSENATYVHSAADAAAGVVNLVLSADNSCNNASDFLTVTLTEAPVSDVGMDFSVCITNPTIDLTGVVSGPTTTGIWSSNGSGMFSDVNTAMTTYTPSEDDLENPNLTFNYTSTENGDCLAADDAVVVEFEPGIVVSAGSDQVVCINSPSTTLQGLVAQGSTTGTWTSQGTGTFQDADVLNATYEFSPGDYADGAVNLVLTSTNNGICAATIDTVMVSFGNTVFVDAGEDVALCEDNLTLDLAGLVAGGATEGMWTTAGTGDFGDDVSLMTNYEPSAADIAAGNFEIYLTSINNVGCDAGQDTVQVSINAIPTVSAGADILNCGDITNWILNGSFTNAEQGVWSTNGTGTFLSETNIPNAEYQPSFADSIIGSVQLFFTTEGSGLCAAVQDTMLLEFGGQYQAVAGEDIEACQGLESVAISGVVNGQSDTGEWQTNGDGTFEQDLATLMNVYVLGPNDLIGTGVELYLTPTNTQGCEAVKDTLFLNLSPLPVVNAGPDQEICAGEATVVLDGTVSNSEDFEWTSQTGGGFLPSNTDLNTAYNVNSVDIQLGSFNLILTAAETEFCPSVADTMVVTVTDPLDVGFTATSTCIGIPAVFTDQTVANFGTIEAWEWTFENGETSNGQNTTQTFDVEGSYDVKLAVTSSTGCRDSLIQSIQVGARPQALFSFSAPILLNVQAEFFDQSLGAETWTWDFGDGLGGSFAQNPNYIFDNAGQFNVRLVVENALGCQDTVFNQINVLQDGILPPKLPNAFTPNGDGQNDVFFVRGGPFMTMGFSVYNNWGEIVFSSTSQEMGWDGTQNGKQMPVGVYTYTVNATTDEGEAFKKVGKVKLLR